MNGASSRWTKVISGVPQGTILGPILFLLYINDLPNIVESVAKLFADDCKLYREISSVDDCEKLQKDLDKLYKWSQDWLLFFNTTKCAVLRLRETVDYVYMIDGVPLESVDEQLDLGVVISKDLKPSKHISRIVKKANARLATIKRCYSDRSRDTIYTLYRALIRPILETNSPIWSPWLKKDVSELDDLQERCEKLCNGQFESLSDRRKKADLRETYKIIHGHYKIDSGKYFTTSSSTCRGHPQKLFKRRCNLDVRRFFFPNRVVDSWNKLPKKVVTSQTVDKFKDELSCVFPEEQRSNR